MPRDDRSIYIIQNDLYGAERARRKVRLVSAVIAIAVVAVVAGGGWLMLSRQANAQPVAVKTKKFTPAEVTKPAPLPTDRVAAEFDSNAAKGDKTANSAGSSDKASVKPRAKSASGGTAASAPKMQTFSIGIGDLGYNPSSVTASSSRPITLKVAKGEGCAAGFLIKKLGVNADNSSKSVTIGLGKIAKGTYRYTCGMEMVEGTLVVD